MILRKPYAFLIKYFKRINILMLLLVVFGFYKNLQIYQFAKDYVVTGVYNVTLDSISNYANIYVYLAFILIIIISAILAYLLRHKDKPYASYVFILIVNIVTFAFFLYTSHYFTYNAIEGYNLVASKVVKDLLFISTLPYYPILFILIIRSIGIDLKSFGFQQDKEFAEVSEEDREEVEVQVEFNRERLIRKFKYRYRYFKYFFLEHKVSLSIVFILILTIFGYNFYHYFYIENRIYTINENFTSNNYRINVKNTYLTDKDYAGNVISEEGRYFALVEIDIENLLNVPRNFDIEKMLLFANQNYYVPTTRFNSYFTDMGNLYTNTSIKPKSKTSYVLIYEIDKPEKNTNFLLKYQDLTSSNAKLIRVKIRLADISTFKTKGNYKFLEEAKIPINEKETVSFKMDNFDFRKEVTYRYQTCLPDSTCPIYEKSITSTNGYKILYMKGDYGTYSTKEFLQFLKKYGHIRYLVDDKITDIDIRFAVNNDYQGKHIYILVPDTVVNSDSIYLAFTIRTYQYFYRIKGE